MAAAGAAFISVVAISTKSAQAANVLYFNDYNAGTDAMAQALAANGDTVTTNSSNFATLISSGSYDLGILFA